MPHVQTKGPVVIPTLEKKLPKTGLDWLKQYDLTEAEQKLFQWDAKNNRLVYLDGDFYNGRTFNEDESKYISYGKKPYRVMGVKGPVVFVEDIISAIKISRVARAICLFGSYIPLNHIPFGNKVVVWLDFDKKELAIEIMHKLLDLGLEATILVTKKDPKCYSTEELSYLLEEK